MKELENLLAKCSFIKKSPAKNDFQKIESLIGFHPPDDYKYYLDNYEEFDNFVGEEYLVLFAFNEVLLNANNRSESKDKLSNTLLIGGNGASEYIGIRAVKPDICQIVIAQYIYDIDDQIEIGVSFTHMLKRLINGIEWFN